MVIFFSLWLSLFLPVVIFIILSGFIRSFLWLYLNLYIRVYPRASAVKFIYLMVAISRKSVLFLYKKLCVLPVLCGNLFLIKFRWPTYIYGYNLPD